MEVALQVSLPSPIPRGSQNSCRANYNINPRLHITMDASRGARVAPELDDGDSEFTQTQPARFWAHTVLAGESYQLALDGTELHLTQACITKPGRAIVSVLTANMDSPVPIVSLRWPEGPLQQLLDLTFFPLDGSVTIRVEGGVDVHFSGSVALVGEPVPEGDEDEEDDDEEEGEGDEEEEEDEEPVPKAAGAAAASSVADKLKRKRDESAASATAPAPTKEARLAPQAKGAAAVTKPAVPVAAAAAKPVAAAAPAAVIAAKPSPAAAAPPPAPKAAKAAAATASPAAPAPEFIDLANGMVKASAGAAARGGGFLLETPPSAPPAAVAAGQGHARRPGAACRRGQEGHGRLRGAPGQGRQGL